MYTLYNNYNMQEINGVLAGTDSVETDFFEENFLIMTAAHYDWNRAVRPCNNIYRNDKRTRGHLVEQKVVDVLYRVITLVETLVTRRKSIMSYHRVVTVQYGK